MKPESMIYASAVALFPLHANIRASDGLAALNCTCGISLSSFQRCVLLDKYLAT
jgi:hypothetical protein